MYPTRAIMKWFSSLPLLLLLLLVTGSEGSTGSTRTTHRDQQDVEGIKAVLLAAFVLILMFLMMSSNRGQFVQAKEINSMNQRILRAVYSQANLKAEIERQVGKDLGRVPPIADLTSFGAHAKGQRAEFGRRFALQLGPYFLGLVVGLAGLHSSISLQLYLSLLFLALAVQWASIYYGGLRKPMERECKCCVCGKVAASSTGATCDGDDDLETMLLECVNCNGTGVCIPACPHCDESKSMVNAMFSGPAACFMCSIYKYMFVACGTFFCRLFGRHDNKGHQARKGHK